VFEEEARYELDVRPRVYGWASGALSYFEWYRDRIVASEAEYVRRLLADDQPPNVIAHSFGGHIMWAMLAKRGFKFHNVILLAPAAPEDTDWHAFEDKFNRVRVYWSLKDEIIGFARYGKMGKYGPRNSHPRVESIETDLLHSDHVQRKRMKEYIEFLRQEGE